MRSVALLTLAALAVAGCSSSPSSDSLGASSPSAMPADAAHWAAQEFSGDFTTTAVVDAMGFAMGPNTVAVPKGAASAWFNGTVTTTVPDGLQVRLIPPSCQQADCFEEAAAPSGTFSIEASEPEAGDWSVVFFADTAAQSGSYTIEVNALVAG